MARGFRLWARADAAGATAEAVGVAAPATRAASGTGPAPRPLVAQDQLRRRARWRDLSPDARAAALHPFAALAPLAPAPTSPRDAAAESWLADVLAPALQADAAALIRAWLADPTPDAHLFALGPTGYGRTSVVAAFARRAMAGRLAPTEYVAVPEPAALGVARALELPTGTSAPFAEALQAFFRATFSEWSQAGDEADAAAIKRAALARTAVALRDASPDQAEGYVNGLLAALDREADAPVLPALADLDAPVRRAGPGDTALYETNGGTGEAPVIRYNPSVHTMARALHLANGGVLIVPADELLEREDASSSWDTLRAALRSGTLPLNSRGMPSVPLRVRVAIVGYSTDYRRMMQALHDFERYIRHLAPFAPYIPWTPEAEAGVAAFVTGAARRLALPPPDADAVGRIVEEAARSTGAMQRAYLDPDLAAIADLVAQSGTLARAESSSAPESLAGLVITERHVERVLAERRARYAMQGDYMRRSILAGRRLVPADGAAVGEITGLEVATPTPTEATYGVPFRVSVAVSPGREHLLDVLREGGKVDESHIVGTLALHGYLAARYGATLPLNVVARVRFEQEATSYGDSASAAALLALLSALADVPLRRSLAITGAVGQYGEMQTIGGVNSKVEGYWEVCRLRRAADAQSDTTYGVLIPAANAADLMLRPDIAAAIAEETWFRVWPVATIDEALALFAGRPAAEVHARVEARLRRFHDAAQPRTSASRRD